MHEHCRAKTKFWMVAAWALLFLSFFLFGLALDQQKGKCAAEYEAKFWAQTVERRDELLDIRQDREKTWRQESMKWEAKAEALRQANKVIAKMAFECAQDHPKWGRSQP